MHVERFRVSHRNDADKVASHRRFPHHIILARPPPQSAPRTVVRRNFYEQGIGFPSSFLNERKWIQITLDAIACIHH